MGALVRSSVLCRSAPALLALLAPACFSPRIDDGLVACGEAGSCPPGLQCGGDGMCYREVTEPLGGDTPGPAEPDAAGPIVASPAGACDKYGGALLCDDFESGTLGRWSGVTQLEGGSVTLSQMLSHGGTTSALGTAGLPGATQGSGIGQLVYAFAGNLKDGDVYLRAWYYLPTGFALNSWIVLMALLPPDGAPFTKVSADIEGGAGREPRFNLVNNVLNGGYMTSAAVPRDRWFCALLHVRLGPSGTGYLSLSIDGTVLAQAAERTVPDSGYHYAAVGMHSSDTNTQAPRLYWDDVVISHSPISCD
jgi:hypothetical protein